LTKKYFFYIHSPLKKFVLLLQLLTGAKEQQTNFSVAKFFASGGEIREWKTGFN
jgi:hypothetical protein